MTISKKNRFEVFKRDGFKCGYCGKAPPEIILEIDHIDPKYIGGSDDLNNLITACFDCNRGKKHIPLDKIPLKLQDNLDILKEQEEQIKKYRKFIKKIENRLQKDYEDIDVIYKAQYEGWRLSDNFKNISLKKFFSLIPKHEIKEAMYLAIRKYPKNKNMVIPYFCGICWHKIKGIPPEKILKKRSIIRQRAIDADFKIIEL